MLLDTQDQEIVDQLPDLSELHATYGVQVNAIPVSELFALYERTGFLYPDKAARLTPHIEQVRENWRRMLRGGESLLVVLTAGDEERGRASLAVWRTTHKGWMSQHLVSESNPYASRAVMLDAAAASIVKGVDESAQNWFRPENRFPTRVFGSMVETIGESLSSVQRHAYFSFPRKMYLPSGSGIRTVAYNSSHKQFSCTAARENLRGRGMQNCLCDELYATVRNPTSGWQIHLPWEGEIGMALNRRKRFAMVSNHGTEYSVGIDSPAKPILGGLIDPFHDARSRGIKHNGT